MRSAISSKAFRVDHGSLMDRWIPTWTRNGGSDRSSLENLEALFKPEGHEVQRSLRPERRLHNLPRAAAVHENPARPVHDPPQLLDVEETHPPIEVLGIRDRGQIVDRDHERPAGPERRVPGRAGVVKQVHVRGVLALVERDHVDPERPQFSGEVVDVLGGARADLVATVEMVGIQPNPHAVTCGASSRPPPSRRPGGGP